MTQTDHRPPATSSVRPCPRGSRRRSAIPRTAAGRPSSRSPARSVAPAVPAQVGHSGRRDLPRPVRRPRPRLAGPRRRIVGARPARARRWSTATGRRHDAACYQVPGGAGRGRAPAAARPGPADGDVAGVGGAARPAARRLPAPRRPARRDPVRGAGAGRALDSNLLLGADPRAVGAAAQRRRRPLAERMAPEAPSRWRARITRGIYRDVIRHDLLGTWLMPRFRDRYAAATPRRLRSGALRAPREFMAGVGRLGTGWCAKSMRSTTRSRLSGCAPCCGTPAADGRTTCR